MEIAHTHPPKKKNELVPYSQFLELLFLISPKYLELALQSQLNPYTFTLIVPSIHQYLYSWIH